MKELQKNKWYKLSETEPPLSSEQYIPLLVCARRNEDEDYGYVNSIALNTKFKGLDEKLNPIYEGITFSGVDKHFIRTFGEPTHFMVIGSPDEIGTL